jgi:hypothetical protein
MGHLFRSEEMCYIQIKCVDDAKELTILELGAFAKFQPIDVRYPLPALLPVLLK